MPDLKEVTYPDLIDMLNAQTAAYISMLRSNAGEEQFAKCKYQLSKIQVEIELRARNIAPEVAPADNSVSISPFTQQDSTLQ